MSADLSIDNTHKKPDKAKTNIEMLMNLSDTLPEFCNGYLLETGPERAISSRIAYARELNWFFSYVIDKNLLNSSYQDMKQISLTDLKNITPSMISRYLSNYLDSGHSRRTTARKRAALSSFFKYMTVNRYLEFNPVDAATEVKIYQSDQVIHLTFEEQNYLLQAIESGCTLDENKKPYHHRYVLRDLAITLLFLDTGMRISELHGLNILDIDLASCSAIVTRKGGDIQVLYYSDQTADAIQDYLDYRSNVVQLQQHDPLFVTEQGKRLSVRAIQQMIDKYTIATFPDKKHLSPHKMRSSFAMGFYKETKDILALQRKLGHKSLVATNIYAKATDEQMEKMRSVTAYGRNHAGDN